jgi:ribosome recycling factor
MFDTKHYTDRFATAVGRFEDELKKVRTGRSHPDMLSGVMVEVYGANMPLNQTASVSAPEPQQLLITPFDPANIQAIAAAIRADQSLGFNPSDDGRNIRVPIPALTEERRREIVKSLNEKVEEARIVLRGIREEARKAAKIQKDAKAYGQDELHRIEKAIDDEVSKFNARIDEIFRAKETEIMTI